MSDAEPPPPERVVDEVPAAVRVEGDAVRTDSEFTFALDQGTLGPESDPLLDALAAWLRDHPEVELLRVEGQADQVGSPRYNYELSVRRADAVRDGLVARGIDPARLQPVGSGEAVLHASGTPLRRVELGVVIWRD